ncbi:unnamed protein product [Heterobilharzia americana]|nr:unnamed protein product [Heterobilharzia americana]CAH8443828.1 unnamed protein product [Heterobilharzia americana]
MWIVIFIYLSLIENLLFTSVGSTGNLTCYECLNCGSLINGTKKVKGCGACVKIVSKINKGQLLRSCDVSCKNIPSMIDAEIYCCETELCNSMFKFTVNFKFIFLFAFISIVTTCFRKL